MMSAGIGVGGVVEGGDAEGGWLWVRRGIWGH